MLNVATFLKTGNMVLFRVEVTFLSLKAIRTVKFAENLWVSFSISCTIFKILMVSIGLKI